jgi:oxalate decarboxylase/phosphoglucose isomerase-like protein (cupin superfamily)
MSEFCVVAGLVRCAETWTIMRANSFRAAETVIPAGLTTRKHSHAGPHLAIALTDLHLRNNLEGKRPVNVNVSAGDINWIPGGFTHAVTNVGTKPARFVNVEFK